MDGVALVALRFRSAPAIVPYYLRIFTARKPTQVLGFYPRIEATLEPAVFNRRQLARYREICGNRPSDTVPIAFPHVLAAPLHLAMMSRRAFPVSPLGLIHVRNRISQQRPLRVEDRMRIRTWVEGHWETDRGQEIDVRTEIDVGSDVLWTEISTYLRRTIRTATRPTRASLSALKAQVPEGAARSSFEADARVGRRYARVSRDFNPIHLADFAARRFGFKRAIAHGMWSVARCVAELPEATFAHPCLLDVAFKAPVMLRASVTLDSWRTNVELKFSLRNSQSGRDHLQGSVRPI